MKRTLGILERYVILYLDLINKQLLGVWSDQMFQNQIVGESKIELETIYGDQLRHQSTTLFLLSLLADQQIEGPYPVAFLIICPVVILGLQYSAVLPRAREVPLDKRVNFWTYAEANKPTWMITGIVLLGSISFLLGF